LDTYPILVISLIAILMPATCWALEEKMGLELEWVFNTSAQFHGMSFGAGHQGCITVWDIDGDNINEVLFGTRRGDSKRLWCLEGDGSFQWVYPPISEDGLPGDPTSKVSIIDVNRDGIYELCFAGRGGRLHILNPDGSVMWTWDEPMEQAMHGAPQAYDVDGDGYLELFLADNAGYVHCLTYDGDLIWISPEGPGSNLGHVTICDLDQDGKLDILWANNKRRVFCADAQTGEEKWHFDTYSTMKYQPVIVADINKDGEYEAIIWTDTPGELICLNWYGEEIWKWALPRPGSIRNCQVMGDVDADGSIDMVIMGLDAGFCVDIGGEQPETKWEVNFSRWSEEGLLPLGATANHWSSYQLVADIDADEEQEILWLAPFPIVTDGSTGELEAYYTNEYIALNRRSENGGWWGDVDGDGVSEWIVDMNGYSHPQTQVYCLTMGGSFPARSPWPEYYHAALPAENQQEQEWLTLKAAGSNSVWFPITQIKNWFTTTLLLIIPTAGSTLGGRKRRPRRIG